MFSARLLVLLLISAACAKRSETNKPTRSAAVSDASATRVHNSFEPPAPYSALFQPENLDLTGFFGPQFVNSNHKNHGVDINALYAQYGSPHQHFAFNYPTRDTPAAQPSRQQEGQRPKGKQPQADAPIPVAIPNKQASEEIFYGQPYAQPPAYVQAQPQYAAIAQHHQQAALAAYAQQAQAQGPAIYETQQPPRLPAAAYPVAFQPQAQQAIQYHPHGHPGIGVQQQQQPQAQQAAFQQAYQQAQLQQAQPPAYATHFQSYQPQGQQQEQPQAPALAAGGRPRGKVNLQAVLQSQVLPQLKGAQGIQLLDLSEFFPPKDGQQPVYFQINPSEDYKTASLTPVQLSSFYQTAGQQQQQQQNSAAKPSLAIPAAAVREPTLSPAEVAAFLQQQAAYSGQAYAPQAPPQAPQGKFPKSSSYAYSQLASTPVKQQQADISAYYAQANRPEETGAGYPGQPLQFTEQDVPRQQQYYYAAQAPGAAPSEEAAPVKSPSNEAQYFKASVAKAVKKVQKATQLPHIASALPPTPNPSPSSKPSKIRQLVKRPHTYGSGYSFEIANANQK